MHGFELAQLNIARLLAPLDSPQLADFVAAIDGINALADAAPGFVWRLQDEDGDATALRPFGAEYIVNLSSWRDIAALQRFVFDSPHAAVMRRRREWFARMAEAWLVLWWVPAGHRPDLAEASERLQQLRAHGAGPAAFTFRQSFPPPVEATAAARGCVERIVLRSARGGDDVEVERAELVAGSGIVGDRYFGRRSQPGQNLTLVEAEQIEAFEARHGHLPAGASFGRNIVTRGVRLEALVGREFGIGGLRLRGVELCEPCGRLGKALATPALGAKAVVQDLMHKAGLRADVLAGGVLERGAFFGE